DPVAVIALRPGANRRYRRIARIGAAGDPLGQREEFDIGNDPDREPGAVWPFERRPVADRGVGVGAVIARFHRSLRRGRIEVIAERNRHPRASGGPEQPVCHSPWVLAFAGTTVNGESKSVKDEGTLLEWRRFNEFAAAELYETLAFRQAIFVVEQ